MTQADLFAPYARGSHTGYKAAASFSLEDRQSKTARYLALLQTGPRIDPEAAGAAVASVEHLLNPGARDGLRARGAVQRGAGQRIRQGVWRIHTNGRGPARGVVMTCPRPGGKAGEADPSLYAERIGPVRVSGFTTTSCGVDSQQRRAYAPKRNGRGSECQRPFSPNARVRKHVAPGWTQDTPFSALQRASANGGHAQHDLAATVGTLHSRSVEHR